MAPHRLQHHSVTLCVWVKKVHGLALGCYEVMRRCLRVPATSPDSTPSACPSHAWTQTTAWAHSHTCWTWHTHTLLPGGHQ
jgi:hypothetical protein